MACRKEVKYYSVFLYLRVLGDNITTVQQAAGHVLSVTGIALDHLVVGLEARVGDLRDRQVLVTSLGSRDDRSISDQGEVNSGVRDQVGLEFVQIDVKGTIETKGSSDGGNNLSDQTVQVGVGGTLNIQVATADIVDSFIIDHESNIRVLKSGVGGQDGVVGLNNGSGNLRSGVHRELKLGLLAVVNRQTFKKQSTETGTGTTTEGVEDKETLKTSAVISESADAVQDNINELLADGVMTTSVVVSSIFLSSDQLLRVEKLTVGTGTDFIDDSGFKIDEDGTGNVLSAAGLREESIEAGEEKGRLGMDYRNRLEMNGLDNYELSPLPSPSGR